MYHPKVEKAYSNIHNSYLDVHGVKLFITLIIENNYLHYKRYIYKWTKEK